MKSRFRLKQRNDFERVRRHGRSYAHPLVVLIGHPNELPHLRIGIVAGRAIGNAVERNRAKRRLRAILARAIPEIVPGMDLVVIARGPARETTFARLDAAVMQLLNRANLLKKSGD